MKTFLVTAQTGQQAKCAEYHDQETAIAVAQRTWKLQGWVERVAVTAPDGRVIFQRHYQGAPELVES